MRVSRILKNIIILFLFTSCKQSSQNVKNNEIKETEVNSKSTNNDENIKFIKEFYTEFYGKYRDRKGIENYVSSRILNKMEDLTKDGNLILDYDPFIKGQDWDTNSLIKSLEITPLKNKNEYRVSFLLIDKNNEERRNIDLLLDEDNNGKLLIYSILNDDYLNFKTQVINENSVRKEDENGLWRLSCEGALTTFDINDDKGYLSLYSYNEIYINLILKETNKLNEYNLYFKSTESKQKYYDDGEYIENDNDISKEKTIGKLILQKDGKARLDWIGLYNTKKQKTKFINMLCKLQKL